MSADITVRKIVSPPNEQTPKYWFAGNAFETHFFNALSSTFPEGERFFIRSVRKFAPLIHDDELQKDVSAFVGQEGQHSREHERHMEILTNQGFGGLNTLNKNMQIVMRWFVTKTPRYALAMTAATEHVTATFADCLMSHEQRFLTPMSDDMQLLWHWHAVEESEHKAVAYDVYQRTGGDYPLRILAMTQLTLGFFVEIFIRHCYLLARDGLLFNLAEWRRGWRFLWNRQGLLRLIFRGHWSYFRRNFHPWDVDNRDKISDFTRRYAEEFELREPAPISTAA